MRISDWSSDVCSSDLIPAVAREAFETLGLRIEAQHRVGTEVGYPDLVGLVDIDRVRTRLVAGEFPGLPVAGRRFVAAELASLPFAYPQHSSALRPDTPWTLPQPRPQPGQPSRREQGCTQGQ